MALTLPDVISPGLRRRWPRLSLSRLPAAVKIAAAMPLGAQQLRRQRTSTLLSLAGVTASLLVIFAQLGIERSVYYSATRIHRAVVADLVLVPAGFKSLQLHANVPVAMTDIVSANPAVARTSPFWFDIMSISHPGMPAPRRIAWNAVDVDPPAIEWRGLRE